MAFKVGNNVIFDNSAILQSTTLDEVPGNIIQAKNITTTNRIEGTVGGGSNPGASDGTSLVAINFTPLRSTSSLWLSTSTISIGEFSNSNDVYYAAAYYDSTRIAISHAPSTFAIWVNNHNAIFVSLNKVFSSWGTSQKTIDLRVGAGNGTGNDTAVNKDVRYPNISQNSEVAISILEFA